MLRWDSETSKNCIYSMARKTQMGLSRNSIMTVKLRKERRRGDKARQGEGRGGGCGQEGREKGKRKREI